MSLLAQPLPLPCGVNLPNRIAKSAMSEDLGDKDHLPDERLCRVYARWAQSGAGLLMTGNVMVDETALGEPHNVVIVPGKGHDALAAWAEAAQSGGAACWPQVNHPGRQSPRTLSRQPVAPSAVELDLPGKVFAPPRALEASEIVDIVGRFARAAGACKAAGFQGVQIHGAHGYLVSQFLSPLSNLRDDEWGGDDTRRRRFLLEVVRAMRAEVGPGFPVGVKLNSADFQRGGFTEDASMEVVSALEAEGIDLLEISGGTYEKPVMAGRGAEVRASTVAREAYFLDYARKVRARTRLPLMLTGGFRTRAGMEAAVAGGAIDVVGLARPMALEPDFPARVLRGEADDSQVEPRRTGVGVLDGLLEVAWYSYQIKRMGRGLDPDPGVWPWTVLAKLGWESLVG
ncbi:MAG: NADH:flavin oxidoreductase/NADH oxidase family protein [Deltaproteobacteria bacterium]|nr:NADH:flavin oxidoreductase/NADH oxidase family protein [Deltaproteobacteria bacterium]